MGTPATRAAQYRWRKKHPEKWKAVHARWRHKRRLKVVEMYGGACTCCGEAHPEFLAIDHEHGGGQKHIRTFSGPMQYYSWLLEKKRKGFRVQCHNCNMARAHWGVCPHERERSEAASCA